MSTRSISLLVVTACASASSPKPTAPPAPTPPPEATPAATSPVVPEHPAIPDVATREKALAALIAEQWEYSLVTHPELATVIGDHRYDDRWTDRSLDAIARDVAKVKDYLARFEAIDTTGFRDQAALDKELMVRRLREQVEGARFEGWLMPVNQMSGPHIQLPQLVQLTRFETVDDYEHYLTRLHAIPAVFDQIVALLRAGVAKQLVPPKILLDQCVGQARGLASGKPEASPFAGPTLKFPATIAKADQERLRAAIVASIKTEIQPAYAAFAQFLEREYVAKGRAEPGEWALPDGDARYAFAVKETTTTDLSPAQIHELGLAEVARIEAEQLVVAKRLGFTDLAALRKRVQNDRSLYAKSRADILARYEKFTAQMYTKLPQLFGHLPKQKMSIRQTEAFREKQAAGAEYKLGTTDGSRPGAVEVNTYDPTKRLVIDMETTAYHEGVPGHHLQIAIQQELGELPPFRQHAHYIAYQEGWALYAEQLGKEVGFYQDPWSYYGHLEDEMLRAIRLVVDTGFHYKRWTRDQVVKFFRDHSALADITVQTETDRYIAWPSQALGYKVGQLTIGRLRREAEDKLGPKFDVRAFHDEVLGAGALPLDVLERRIHAWIERVAK
jgi:uncharacterized protein (DUF885 family)